MQLSGQGTAVSTCSHILPINHVWQCTTCWCPAANDPSLTTLFIILLLTIWYRFYFEVNSPGWGMQRSLSNRLPIGVVLCLMVYNLTYALSGVTGSRQSLQVGFVLRLTLIRKSSCTEPHSCLHKQLLHQCNIWNVEVPDCSYKNPCGSMCFCLGDVCLPEPRNRFSGTCHEAVVHDAIIKTRQMFHNGSGLGSARRGHFEMHVWYRF